MPPSVVVLAPLISCCWWLSLSMLVVVVAVLATRVKKPSEVQKAKAFWAMESGEGQG